MQPDALTQAIAQDLGVSDFPLEEQQQIIGQFGEVALKAATLAVVSRLSPDKRDEFARLAEAGEAGPLQVFLNTEVPEHEALAKGAVEAEVKSFKASLAT